jgi:hypothetical protein
LRLPESGNGIRLSVDGTRLAFTSWVGACVHLYELAIPRAVQQFTVPQAARYADHFTAQAVFSPGGELVPFWMRKAFTCFNHPIPRRSRTCR